MTTSPPSGAESPAGTPLAYVNGRFVPLAEACIPIEDRGYLFADGVYEVIVAYDGRPFRMAEHLQRLRRSAAAIRLDFDFDRHGLEPIIAEGIRQAGFRDTMIYLQLTRGVAPRSHAFPHDTPITVVAMFRACPTIRPEVRAAGVALITTPEIRWANCHIKSIALLPNVLAKQKALDAGAYDAVFCTDQGEVHECSSSNIFLIKDGVLRTPPKNQWILHGITRQYVLECAERLGMATVEEPVHVDELFAADELFITSTTMEMLAVVRLDGRAIGTGRPGPQTEALHAEFRRGIAEGG